MTRSRDTANIVPTIDAKGDIFVGTGESSIENLSAGVDGLFLQTDSSQPTGLKWSQAGGDSDQAVIAGQVFG